MNNLKSELQNMYHTETTKISIDFHANTYRDKITEYFIKNFKDDIQLSSTSDHAMIVGYAEYTLYVFSFNNEIIRFIDTGYINNIMKMVNAATLSSILTRRSICDHNLINHLIDGDVVIKINDRFYFQSGGIYYKTKVYYDFNYNQNHIDPKFTKIERSDIINLAPFLTHVI